MPAIYATYEQVQAVLTRDLARVEGNAAALSEAQIVAGIEEAQAEIDAKLSPNYTVPFSPVPTLVTKLTIDLAGYLSDLTYREIKDYGSTLSPVYLRYQRAEEMLGQLQAGTAVIPADGNTPSPSTASGSLVVASYSRNDLVCPVEFDIGLAGVPGTSSVAAGYNSLPGYMTPNYWGQY